jgi:hypothetical protein
MDKLPRQASLTLAKQIPSSIKLNMGFGGLNGDDAAMVKPLRSCGVMIDELT